MSKYPAALPRLVLTLALVPCAPVAHASNAAVGKLIFESRCRICHSAEAGDGGGAQGPSLAGVYGRAAASVTGFGYSQALRAAHLTWDGPTLAKFLSAPTTLVPGTAMVVAVEDPVDRGNLLAYLRSLPSAAPAAPVEIVVPPETRRSADWRNDAPGRRHRIDLSALPAPHATPSSSNSSMVVAQPPGAAPRVPAGFRIDAYATGLLGPRKLLLAANGDVFVTETDGGRISVLHPARNGRRARQSEVYAQGLRQPFGIAFYPSAAAPRWLYVAETQRVIRYPFAVGDTHPRGAAEVVVASLPTGGHYTRDIAFSADGKRLFISVGSASNVGETMPKKSAAEIAAWETGHGLGAAWGDETDRAAVLVTDVEPPATLRPFANGIRNCVSLTPQPATGDLWCTTNERDLLGDDLVPDYSTRVTAGAFYGWPWYYLGSHEDPRLAGERPDLADKVTVPDIAYQSHSAPLGLTFYEAKRGASAFPADYAGDAFVTFHGSWNRSLRTGYKLVRVPMRAGRPTGEYEDFVTGFVVDDGHVWGRPVATVELADGSLLMSDDASNTVWRIAATRQRAR